MYRFIIIMCLMVGIGLLPTQVFGVQPDKKMELEQSPPNKAYHDLQVTMQLLTFLLEGKTAVIVENQQKARGLRVVYTQVERSDEETLKEHRKLLIQALNTKNVVKISFLTLDRKWYEVLKNETADADWPEGLKAFTREMVEMPLSHNPEEILYEIRLYRE